MVCGPGIIMIVILCGEEEDEDAGEKKTAVEGEAITAKKSSKKAEREKMD